jgi:chromosome segregation ATPase
MELLTIGLLGTLLGGGAALGISKLLKPKEIDVEKLLSLQQADLKAEQEQILREKERQFKKELQEKEEQMLKDVKVKEETFNQVLAKESELLADLKKYEAKEEAYERALKDFKAKEEQIFKGYQETFKDLEKQQLTLSERLSQIQGALQNSSFEELSAISSSSFGMLAMQLEQMKNALKTGTGFEGVSEFETRLENLVAEFKREKQALAETKDSLSFLKDKVEELLKDFETEKKYTRKKEEEAEQSFSEAKNMVFNLTEDLKAGKPFNINDVDVKEIKIRLNALIDEFKIEKQTNSENMKSVYAGINTLMGTSRRNANMVGDKSY